MDPRQRTSRHIHSCMMGLALLALSALALPQTAMAYQIQTIAKHAILMDAATGQVLFDKNGDKPMAPASMAKLMTIEMVFHALKTGRLKLTDTFHVSKKAWAMKNRPGGSKMFVLVGTDITVANLLRGIIVDSGNDACVVVAEGMAGSEAAFAQQLNERAKELGLHNSHFVNANGWPNPQEYMSARDLAKLTRHIITAYPKYYPIFADKEFTWSKIRQYNRNPLLWTSIGADGLKTGHTEASGYGLVSSAVQNGERLILVLNGLDKESERKTESMRMLQIGFRDFRNYNLLAAKQIVATAPVFGGQKDEVGLLVKSAVSRILNRDSRQDMKVNVDFKSPLIAPVKAGTQVGKLTIAVPGTPDLSVPVYTADSVSRMGPLAAMGTGFTHMFLGLMGENNSLEPATAKADAPSSS